MLLQDREVMDQHSDLIHSCVRRELFLINNHNLFRRDPPKYAWLKSLVPQPFQFGLATRLMSQITYSPGDQGNIKADFEIEEHLIDWLMVWMAQRNSDPSWNQVDRCPRGD